jgi:hypothetical protein
MHASDSLLCLAQPVLPGNTLGSLIVALAQTNRRVEARGRGGPTMWILAAARAAMHAGDHIPSHPAPHSQVPPTFPSTDIGELPLKGHPGTSMYTLYRWSVTEWVSFLCSLTGDPTAVQTGLHIPKPQS